MPVPDPMEVALARLMPTALSVSGQRSIEEMLDELAAEVPAPVHHRFRRPLIGLAAAAAVAGVITLSSLFHPQAAPMARVLASAPAPGVEWMAQSERVESVADEGWVSGADGSAMQALRLRVVGENTVRDEETGYTVRVSEPREEMLLMPVSAF